MNVPNWITYSRKKVISFYPKSSKNKVFVIKDSHEKSFLHAYFKNSYFKIRLNIKLFIISAELSRTKRNISKCDKLR